MQDCVGSLNFIIDITAFLPLLNLLASLPEACSVAARTIINKCSEDGSRVAFWFSGVGFSV